MRKIISTDQAPAAVGPYSQAIKVNGFVFTAGQLPLKPETGTIVPGGIQAETQQALLNLKAVLEAAGSSPARVVKTTVFLKDMNDFPAMNQVYAKFFAENPPARSTIQVVLPKGALIEIEAIALCD